MRQISITIEHGNEVTKANQKAIEDSIEEDISGKGLEKRGDKGAKSHSIDSNKAEGLKADVFLEDDPFIRRKLHGENDSEHLRDHVCWIQDREINCINVGVVLVMDIGSNIRSNGTKSIK